MYSQLQGWHDGTAGVRLDCPADHQPGLIISANEIFWISAGISSSCWGWCGLPDRRLRRRWRGGAHSVLQVKCPVALRLPGLRYVQHPAKPALLSKNATAIVTSDKAALLKSIHDSEKTTGVHHAEHTRRQVPALSRYFSSRPSLA